MKKKRHIAYPATATEIRKALKLRFTLKEIIEMVRFDVCYDFNSILKQYKISRRGKQVLREFFDKLFSSLPDEVYLKLKIFP